MITFDIGYHTIPYQQLKFSKFRSRVEVEVEVNLNLILIFILVHLISAVSAWLYLLFVLLV